MRNLSLVPFFSLVHREKHPGSHEPGRKCLDIEIYLKALEAVHAAGFGEGVQVLFRILNRHCEASEELVIT